MPRDGTGQYNLPNPAVVTATAISSTDENATRSDMATAFTASLARDGQTVPTANLPMGAFRHTGVANATARNHYAGLGQLQDGGIDWRGVATGTGDAITITTNPVTTAYVTGEPDVFLVNLVNTGAVTINKNGLGVRNLFTGSGAALAAGLLQPGMTVTTRYDGTQFRIMALGGTNTGAALLTTATPAAARTVLDAPSVAAMTAGDIWVDLNNGTAAISGGPAVVQLTLPSGYTAFKVVFDRIRPSSGAAGNSLYCRVSIDNAVSFLAGASDYLNQGPYVEGAVAAALNASSSIVQLTANGNSASVLIHSGELLIYPGDGTDGCRIINQGITWRNNSGVNGFSNLGGYPVVNTLVTHFQFGFVGGTTFSNVGKIRILGLKT